MTELRRRWRVDLSYDGSAFSGWAAQPGRRTVQAELADALATVLRLPEPVTLTCAGRTDAGVHARGQVAHLDLGPEQLSDGVELTRRLARVLPPDVVVAAVTPAPDGFDARFAALWRRYVYRLTDGTVAPDPRLRAMVTTVRDPLDLAAIDAAGASMLGLRDFAPFCRRRAGASTVRTLLRCDAERISGGLLDGVVEVTVVADAFCHSMVRSLVGALVAVAAGRRDPAWLAGVATAGERVATVEVLPAGGLTLEEVGYPAPDRLAARVRESRSVRQLPGGGPG